MVFAYRDSAISENFTNSLTVTMPTNVDDDQLFMAVIVQSSSVTVSSTPSGWTEIDTRQNGNIRSYLYRRIASSEPASYTLSLSGFSQVMATVESFDVDSFATPFTDWNVAEDSNATRITSNSVTTDADDGGFIHYLLVRDGSGTSTWGTPSGYTKNDDNAWSQSRIMTYSKVQSTAGASGGVTFIEPDEDFAYDDVTVYSIAVDTQVAGAATLGVAFGGAGGITPAAEATALLQVEFGAAAGLPATVLTDSVFVDVAFGAAGGMNTAISKAVELGVGFGGAAGLGADIDASASIAVSFGGAAGLSGVASFGPALIAAAFGASGGLVVDLSPTAGIRIAFGGTAGFRDAYIGPGSGIVVLQNGVIVPKGKNVSHLSPLDGLDHLSHLREGDMQNVILPWAYVNGVYGRVRLLVRSISDDQGRQRFEVVEFEPVPDVAVTRKLARGERPKHRPPVRGDVAGQIRTVEREVDRLRRRRDQS